MLKANCSIEEATRIATDSIEDVESALKLSLFTQKNIGQNGKQAVMAQANTTPQDIIALLKTI